jgi:hypothetical protein
MKENPRSFVQDVRLLELVEAVVDLFPSHSNVRQVGNTAAPELLINWRTGGVGGRTGNLSWGVLFRFASGSVERYGDLDNAARVLARGGLRRLAQDLRFFFDGSDAQSLFVLDVPDSLFGTTSRTEKEEPPRIVNDTREDSLPLDPNI